MASVVLSNHKFPEDGQVSIPLPIPPEEYDHYMEQLDELCIGHATWRDCMVDSIDSDYPALERLQGELVNLDELDYLFQRLDSFDEHEKAAFQSVMYDRDFIDMTDLINLTFCCDMPVVITEFSALDALGKKQHSISQGGGGMGKDVEKPYERAIMEHLIRSEKGIVTPYGVLYENGMKLEQCYHEGGVFPKYRYRERVMEVEISDCAEPEDTLAVSSLQLPLSKKQIEHIVERTGIQNADDIRLWFVDSILPERIEAGQDPELQKAGESISRHPQTALEASGSASKQRYASRRVLGAHRAGRGGRLPCRTGNLLVLFYCPCRICGGDDRPPAGDGLPSDEKRNAPHGASLLLHDAPF